MQKQLSDIYFSHVGKKPVKFNIPEAEAVDRLVDLIREHGKWVEPELEAAVN